MKRGLARLFDLAGEKKSTIIFSSLLSALAAIAQILPFFASYKIAAALLLNSSDLAQQISFWALVAIASLVLSMLLVGAAFILSHFAAYRILYNIRLRLCEHLARLPLGFFSQHSKGEIHKNIQENVEFIENFIAHKIPEFVMTASQALFLFGVFFYVDFRVGLLAFLVYALALYINFSIYKKESMKAAISEYFTRLERINSSSIELVRGISIVKLFSKNIENFGFFARNLRAYRDFTLDFAKRGMRSYLVFASLVNGFVFVLLPLFAFLLLQKGAKLELVLELLFFLLLCGALISPMLNIITLSRALMQINEGVARVDSLFKQRPLSEPQKSKIPANFDIEFKNLSFAYKDKEVLKDISFKLKQGQSLAIIGESGAGKSTILNLLARFYDFERGEILIGGVSIKELKNEDLMRILSPVFQESFLFKDSLRANIQAGLSASDEEILKASKLAGCESILAKHSLDAIIGEQGFELSLGEAMRINIARALLKNTPILLLDEINAALDYENELKIKNALDELKKDKCVLIIAHRLSSIKNADLILFLQKGCIKALGTHEELLRQSKEYQELLALYEDIERWRI